MAEPYLETHIDYKQYTSQASKHWPDQMMDDITKPALKDLLVH